MDFQKAMVNTIGKTESFIKAILSKELAMATESGKINYRVIKATLC